MNFQQWFILEILHEYFDNEVCRALNLVPMVSTQRVMRNYDIRIEALENLFYGYVGGVSLTSPWDALQRIDDLFFQLINSDPNFDNYTDITIPKEAGTLLYLKNPTVGTDQQTIAINTYLPLQSLVFQVKIPSGSPIQIVIKNGQGVDIFNQLTHNNQSSISIDISAFGTGVYELWMAGALSKTFIGTSEKIQRNCYGILHLQMDSILATLKNKELPVFKVSFIAKATYWQYAVVVSQDKKITVQDIGIESVNGEPYLGPIKKIVGSDLADLFTSPNIIKLHQKARAGPILKMHYKNDFSDIVLELDIKMPQPDVSKTITKKENNKSLFYSQTIIYV